VSRLATRRRGVLCKRDCWCSTPPQILEEESQWAEAIKQYQSSADYYTAENAPTTGLKALAKVAELSARVSSRCPSALPAAVPC